MKDRSGQENLGPAAGDGFVHTGYAGRFKQHALHEIVGRDDGLVNLEGRRACLDSIEEAMLQHRRLTWVRANLFHTADGDPHVQLEYEATGETDVEDIEEHAVGISGSPTTGEWCRFSVQIGQSDRVYLGGERYRTVGVAIAQVFVPLRIGDKKALEHAEAIQDAFRGASVASPSIVFRSPYLTASLREETFWQVNIVIPFEVTEHV